MIRNTASAGSIEILESRLLMAANTDTVTVRGTDSSDLMTVQVRLAKDGSKELQVTINGIRRRFNLTGINTISIESLGGNDQIFVNENTVRPIVINGGLGDDSIVGGAGNDRITGGRGFDTLTGNDGNDLLKGYDSSDTLLGHDGNDTLDGGTGSDFMIGGDDNDQLTGGAGTDQMFGEGDDDTFFAEDDEVDTLSGGDGDNFAQTFDDDDLSSQIFD